MKIVFLLIRIFKFQACKDEGIFLFLHFAKFCICFACYVYTNICIYFFPCSSHPIPSHCVLYVLPHNWNSNIYYYFADRNINQQFPQNLSEYHPPIGVWIACLARRPPSLPIATPRLQPRPHTTPTRGQTVWWLKWIWKLDLLGLAEVAMIPMMEEQEAQVVPNHFSCLKRKFDKRNIFQ